jgi:hypothetical protein
MKAKDLATLLELIVRKVVKEELKPILKEVRNSSKPIIKEVHKPKRRDPLDISHVLEESRANTPKAKPTQEFTKNPTLNSILNETANDGEWRNMDGQFGANQAQGFNRAGMADALGYGDGQSNMIPTTDIDGRPVDTNNEQVAAVGAALTKDYSALMKTINAKKGK